jgi:hypothetical protein
MRILHIRIQLLAGLSNFHPLLTSSHSLLTSYYWDGSNRGQKRKGNVVFVFSRLNMVTALALYNLCIRYILESKGKCRPIF